MADIVPMPEFEDMTEFERDLVGKAVNMAKIVPMVEYDA